MPIRPAVGFAAIVAMLLVSCGGKADEVPCVHAGCPEAQAQERQEAESEEPAETCPRPYMVRTLDERCVWSCAEGTTPGYVDRRPECVCREGLVEVGTDQFTRRVCRQ